MNKTLMVGALIELGELDMAVEEEHSPEALRVEYLDGLEFGLAPVEDFLDLDIDAVLVAPDGEGEGVAGLQFHEIEGTSVGKSWEFPYTIFMSAVALNCLILELVYE